MVEHTVKFDLPDESTDLLMCLKGGTYYSIINDFLNTLRARLKYNDISDEQREIYEELQSFLWGLLDEEGVSHDF